MNIRSFLLIAIFSFCICEDLSAQDTIRNDSVYHRFLPGLAYSPVTGLVVAARLKTVFRQDSSTYSKSSSVDNLVYVTTMRQLVFRNKLELFSRKGWAYNIVTQYNYFPISFYGIGQDTEESDEETILIHGVSNVSKIEKGLTNRHFLGINFLLRYNQIKGMDDSPLYDQMNLTFKNGGFLTGLGPSFTYDTRDHLYYPHSGMYASLFNRTNTDFSSLVYSNLIIDLRWYSELWNDKNLIAIQLRTAQATGEVPFFDLNNLGGSNQLRGFHRSRFIDNNATYLQVEGRKHFYRRWKLAGFVGTGYVGEHFFDLQELRWAIGGGMRYELIPRSRLNLLGDLALSDEGRFEIYIGLNEAF